MATFYNKYAQLEVLVSGTDVEHAASTATLFASGSATEASLYFFKGNGDKVDLGEAGSGGSLTADGDSGGTVSVDLSTDTFDIAGGTGCDTTIAKVGTDVTLTIDIDLGEATEAAVDVSTDYALFLDGGAAGTTRKDSWADIATAQAGSVTTTGMAASSGVFNWDLQNWTAATSVADADLVGIDDGAGGTLRKMTRANFLGSTVAAFSNGLTATTVDATTDFTIDGLVLTADTITNDAALSIVSTGLTLNASLDIALSADGGNVTMDDGTTTVFDFNTDDPTLKIMDDADTGDYFSINVGAAGATAITTVDDDGAAANLTITADGTVDIDSAGALTLDSGAGILLEPAAGSVITLDGTITVDAGVVAGATSVTSTAFLGTLDGVVGGNTPAAGTFTTCDATTDFTIDGLVLTADTITNDAALSIVSTGLTLDASLDIALSADGGNVTMDDGTTTVFDFNTDDPELKIMDDAQVANYCSIAVGANGATTLTTVDADAAAANLIITADGTVDIDSAGALTLDSGAGILLEPAAGSVITLDGTITVDAGVVAGATSVTSTNFDGIIGAGTARAGTFAAVIGTTGDFSSNVTMDGNVTLGDASTDVTTATGQLTASAGMLVADDKKLYFGTGEDWHMMYDEADDDALVLSGTALNISVTQGLDITIQNNDSECFVIKEGNDEYLTIDSTTDSELITFGVADLLVKDDLEVMLGTSGDTQLFYDSGGDYLVISGSGGENATDDGVVISGSGLVIATDNGILVKSDSELEFGDDGSSLFYHSDGEYLVISGSGDEHDYGTVFSGSSVIFQNSGSVTLRADLELEFGINGDSFIEFDSGVEQLVISGSGDNGGTVIKGTTLDIDTDQGMSIYDDLELVFGDDGDGAITFDSGNSIFKLGVENEATDIQVILPDGSGAAEGIEFLDSDDTKYFTIKTDDGNEEIVFGESTAGQQVTFHASGSGAAMYYLPDVNAMVSYLESAETVRIGGDSTAEYAVDVGGGSAGTNNINKIRASAFVTFSDERMKSNFSTINNATDTVNRINPVNFTWKSDGTKDFGFVAQDLQKVIPQAVHGDADSGYGIDYGRLTSVLVKALQEQSAEIALLKQKIEDI